eukprot:COSAG02_NODE_1087_length_14672_cov_189.858437_2_plen_115_part_00
MVAAVPAVPGAATRPRVCELSWLSRRFTEPGESSTIARRLLVTQTELSLVLYCRPTPAAHARRVYSYTEVEYKYGAAVYIRVHMQRRYTWYTRTRDRARLARARRPGAVACTYN